MPRRRHGSTRLTEQEKKRRGRHRGPTPRRQSIVPPPSHLHVAAIKLARVAAISLAAVGIFVLIVGWIWDWPWWLGIGFMSPLGVLLLFDEATGDALFGDAWDDGFGDFGGGGDGGGGDGGG